jgi:Ca2+/Na+ antiporter
MKNVNIKKMNMKKTNIKKMLLTLTLLMSTLLMLTLLMLTLLMLMMLMLMLMLIQRLTKMKTRRNERENEREFWSIEKKIEEYELYWFINQKMYVNLSRKSINPFLIDLILNDVDDDVIIDSMMIEWKKIIWKLITSTSHSNLVRFISTHDAHLTKWLSIQ